MRSALIVVGLACSCATIAWAQDTAPATEQTRLQRLLDRIADGDPTGDAFAELADRVLGPLVDALEEERSGAAQRRVDEALRDLIARLRYRVAVRSLPEQERALVAKLRQRNPDLITNLYHENEDVRHAALARIPLEPNSGAGVLLALKFEDASAPVREAAVKLAHQLDDAILARALTHQVQRWVNLLQGDALSPTEKQVYSVLFAEWIREAAQIVADHHSVDSASAFAEALTLYDGANGALALPQYPTFTGDVITAIGKSGATEHQALLERFLTDASVYQHHRVPEVGLITQTVGDAAMIAILRLHDQDPERFGFTRIEDPEPLLGFAEDNRREAARQRFRDWLLTRSGTEAKANGEQGE